MADYKLTYFNFTAVGEQIRFLFEYGGIPYEDIRVSDEEWPALKPKTPFGVLPVLEYKGKVIHQSIAIARFLAKKVNLVGKDEWEDLEIDAIVDTVNDMRAKVAIYHYEKEPNRKAQLRKSLDEDVLPFYISRLDEAAKKNNGYLAVGRLTWADFYLVGLLSFLDYMAQEDVIADAPNLKAVKEHVESLPAIKAWIARRPKTN